MIQKLKKIGLFSILSIFLVAVAPNFIGVADALESPQVELSRVLQEGDNAYDVMFKVYAGNEDLSEGKLLITSDVSQTEALYRGVKANSVTGTDKIRIAANDPSSIVAQFVTPTSKAIPAPAKVSEDSKTGFYIERRAVIQEGDSSYDVYFRIFAGNEDAPQGKIVVTTDISQSEVSFSGLTADSFGSTNQIRIAADDPSSIVAKYVAVEPERDFENVNRVDGKLR